LQHFFKDWVVLVHLRGDALELAQAAARFHIATRRKGVPDLYGHVVGQEVVDDRVPYRSRCPVSLQVEQKRLELV
jgi:hypothetical protein